MTWERIEITDYARLSVNPLRKLKFDQAVEPNPDKRPITFQLGDPTVFGNFPPARETLDALRKAFETDKFPYNPGHGKLEAREAVAETSPDPTVTADDVILTSGCAHAIEMCVLSLVKRGENLLIPRPCYSYGPLTDGMEIESRAYNLDPSKGWQIDLEHMESLIDSKTRVMIINNPGNPCGNVFSKKHILDIIAIAEKHKLPIIADEIYEHMTYPGVAFHAISSLSKNVPILTCGGLTKRYLMPGLRMGWIIVNDRHSILTEVKQGLRNVTGRIQGPNSTVQEALPDILRNTPQKFFDVTMERVERHAITVYNILKDAPGLKPIMPKGSMYLMVQIEMEKFPEYSSCLEFTNALISEESILVYPGFPSFNFPGFMRIVLTAPEDLIVEAGERIIEFCNRHIQKYENVS